MKSLRFFFQYFFIPCLLIAVACFQISRLKNGLSTWKGGGFGMYADYYPLQFDLHLNEKLIILDKKKDLVAYQLGRMTMIYPTDENAKKLIFHLKPKSDTVRLQIYSPSFSGAHHELSQKITYDKTFFNIQKAKP